MDIYEAVNNFIKSGSGFVHVSSDAEQVSLPCSAIEIWKLAGQMNSAGLAQTANILDPNLGKGREEQLDNLRDQMARVLESAGFAKASESEFYDFYTRPAVIE